MPSAPLLPQRHSPSALASPTLCQENWHTPRSSMCLLVLIYLYLKEQLGYESLQHPGTQEKMMWKENKIKNSSRERGDEMGMETITLGH